MKIHNDYTIDFLEKEHLGRLMRKYTIALIQTNWESRTLRILSRQP